MQSMLLAWSVNLLVTNTFKKQKVSLGHREIAQNVINVEIALDNLKSVFSL